MRCVPKINLHHGFTLIELMVVVAIIGVLAAVAIPSFTRYIRASKTTDGYDKIKAIADSALSYYHSEHIFAKDGSVKLKYIYPGCQTSDSEAFTACTNKVLGTPTVIGQKTELAGTNTQPWKRLRFDIAGPTYYHFRYTSTLTDNTSTFRAAAQASFEAVDDHTLIVSGNEDGVIVSAHEGTW